MIQEERAFFEKLRYSIKLPLGFLAVLWIIQIIQSITPFSLARYGILPRHMDGLFGIITGPMIHGSYLHLVNNSLPFIVGSLLMLFFYRRVAVISFVIIYTATGLLVWLFGKSAFHIGLSGVVYGIIAFIFWMGVFRRSLKSIALALVVAFMYSGMIYGIFPVRQGVSWESHLFGVIVGAITALGFRNVYEEEEKNGDGYVDEERHREDFFLDRDVFNLTKEERRSRDETSDDEDSFWHSNSSW